MCVVSSRKCIMESWLDVFNLFFFSSRRRHTRWTGDWSSDVCSSDLFLMTAVWFFNPLLRRLHIDPQVAALAVPYMEALAFGLFPLLLYFAVRRCLQAKIGRASCRERVEVSDVCG